MDNEARLTRGPLKDVQRARLLADDRQLRAFDFDIDLANVLGFDFDNSMASEIAGTTTQFLTCKHRSHEAWTPSEA